MATGVTVEFNANLARWTSSIDKVTNDLSKFQSNADRIGRNVTKIFGALGVGLSAVAITAFGKSMIDAADNIGKAAEKSGIAVEKFSALNYAAGQSEVSTQGLTTALKFLSGAIVGNDKVLDALGVQVKTTTGSFIETDEILLDVAEAFKSLPDGALKSEAAIKLFGKSGLDMINLLNQGKSGIQEFTAEASKLGLVISGDTAKAADEFNDNLGRLKGTLVGIANEVLPAFLDGLKKVTDLFGIGGKPGGQTSVFDFYTDRIRKAQEEIDLITARKNTFTTAITDQFGKTSSERLEELKLELAELIKLRVISTQDTPTKKPTVKPVDTKKLTEVLNPGGNTKNDKEKNQLDALKKSNDEYVKSLQNQAVTVGFTTREVALYEESQKKLSVTQSKLAVEAINTRYSYEESSASLKKLADDTAQFNEEAGNLAAGPLIEVQAILADLYNENESAALKYLEDFKLLSTYLDGAELEDAITRLNEKFGGIVEKNKSFAEEWKEDWENAAAGFTSSIGGAVANAVIEQKQFADLLRVSVKSMAREVIASLVSIAAKKAVLWAAEKLNLISTAAAAAPAAAGVTLASFGANVPIALAGIAATFAASKALSGQAHDGLDNVPKTGTYLLEGGERVVKKEDNKRLERFLDGESAGNISISFNVQGRDAPNAVDIVRSQKSQIIGIIQNAYSERGRRGGPVS